MRRFRTALIAILIATPILLTTAYAQTTEKPDLSKQPTLYVVGYAHLDTEWRWEYPQVIDEYIHKTMEGQFHFARQVSSLCLQFQRRQPLPLNEGIFSRRFLKAKEIRR